MFNEDVRQMVLREEIKARRHPGKTGLVAQPLPEVLIKSIIRSLEGQKIINVLFELVFIH